MLLLYHCFPLIAFRYFTRNGTQKVFNNHPNAIDWKLLVQLNDFPSIKWWLIYINSVLYQPPISLLLRPIEINNQNAFGFLWRKATSGWLPLQNQPANPIIGKFAQNNILLWVKKRDLRKSVVLKKQNFFFKYSCAIHWDLIHTDIKFQHLHILLK